MTKKKDKKFLTTNHPRKYTSIANMLSYHGAFFVQVVERCSRDEYVEFGNLDPDMARRAKETFGSIKTTAMRSYTDDPLIWITDLEMKVRSYYLSSGERKSMITIDRNAPRRGVWKDIIAEAALPRTIDTRPEAGSKSPGNPYAGDARSRGTYELEDDEIRALSVREMAAYFEQWDIGFANIPYPEGKDEDWAEEEGWAHMCSMMSSKELRILALHRVKVPGDHPRYREFVENPSTDPQWLDWAMKNNWVADSYRMSYPKAPQNTPPAIYGEMGLEIYREQYEDQIDLDVKPGIE